MSDQHRTTDEQLREKLARFGAWCFDSHRGDCCEPGDIDGGSIQAQLVKLGLLETREVTKPCGKMCVCGPSEKFPVTCYFQPPGLRDLVNTLTRSST
jgi:hypothetical protein